MQRYRNKSRPYASSRSSCPTSKRGLLPIRAVRTHVRDVHTIVGKDFCPGDVGRQGIPPNRKHRGITVKSIELALCRHHAERSNMAATAKRHQINRALEVRGQLQC